ncbi:MAG: hypothetical protein CVU56_03765 [Deltaproteobacteria bacterium HGW-Deltaproteobacteria-14]|nr:MAG: hypothetical protein CVU56_03765 [Deltaproteobacteria bacterium HGW-Deltaproteobacteria-14]
MTVLGLVAPGSRAAGVAPKPPATPVRVVAELVEPGPATPHCGILHLLVVMRYKVVRVEAGAPGELLGSELDVAVSCPEQHGVRFVAGARHRLTLTTTRPWPTGSIVADPKRPKVSPGTWALEVASASEPASVREALTADGVLAFSDGSSVYRIHADGRFALDPLGISGRTVAGTWESDDDRVFVVTGKWGWVNGLSRDDDYRRMTLAVSVVPGEGPPPGMDGATLTRVYLVIEELVKITKAEHDRAASKPN